MEESIEEYVAKCATLAMLLEVSGYPKPGNVHRLRDAHDTRFEHFLAGAVAVGPSMGRLAERGRKAGRGEIDVKEISLGYYVLEAVKCASRWHKGGNTNLGEILLFAPLSAAAGMCFALSGGVSSTLLRKNVVKVIDGSTVEDAVNVYEAIRIVKPGGLGEVEKFDVNDPAFREKIVSEGVSLKDIFAISAGWDAISAEWVNGMSTVFDLGYPSFKKYLEEERDVNIATVNTFLRILSEKPDTLIIRKAGAKAAEYVSVRAREVLEAGGISTPEGRRLCWMLDEELHSSGGRLNPGATADLTAASIFVYLLEGLRY
ncbi:MAG: triphosphoribosyl-dephospho-CoA synthase [Candidatus Jordarchaeales archaeon]